MTIAVHVYLAARYSRREELCDYRRQLQTLVGKYSAFEVTSRWLDGSHTLDADGLSVEAHDAERRRFAEEDLTDLRRADIVVAFTEQPRATNTRGGRHVELGVAIGLGKNIIVVGPAENVFCCLSDVTRFESWGETVELLHRTFISETAP